MTTGVLTERNKFGFFSYKNMTLNLDLQWVTRSFHLPRGNYVQFDGMVYKQIVEIRINTNGILLLTDLFLYCYEKDFMSNLQKDTKEEIWPSPMTKAPTPTEMSKGQIDNTNNATKKFD